MSRNAVLMVHGVNSTLEWAGTAKKVLEPHFECQLLRYRYFHSLWGPIKVYFWPTALLSIVGFCFLSIPTVASQQFGTTDRNWRLDNLWTNFTTTGIDGISLSILALLCVLEALIVIPHAGSSVTFSKV